jgi:hypothetical protein
VDALEDGALLQLAVVGEDRSDPGAELAALVGKVAVRASRAARTACRGVASSGDAAIASVIRRPWISWPGEQHLPLVGEVPEERGLGQTGALGDLVDGGGVVALLGEQGRPRRPPAAARVRFPSAMGTSIVM